MNRPLLAVAVVTALAAAAVSLYIVGHPFIPLDATVERDVQATDWGPLTVTFRFFSWIGDAKGLVVEVAIFLAIVVLNRRAWLFAAGAVLSGAWYELGTHLVNRPRPTPAQVLRVTEHPGASSFPSGHTIFIVTVTVVLMLSFGYRFLPRPARIVGWVLVVLIVAANALARVYTGAHWPSDIVGGILIAAAWLIFLASIDRVGSRLFSANPARRPAPSAPRIHERPARTDAG